MIRRDFNLFFVDCERHALSLGFDACCKILEVQTTFPGEVIKHIEVLTLALAGVVAGTFTAWREDFPSYTSRDATEFITRCLKELEKYKNLNSIDQLRDRYFYLKNQSKTQAIDAAMCVNKNLGKCVKKIVDNDGKQR